MGLIKAVLKQGYLFAMCLLDNKIKSRQLDGKSISRQKTRLHTALKYFFEFIFQNLLIINKCVLVKLNPGLP
jgi:hypothetical protein